MLDNLMLIGKQYVTWNDLVNLNFKEYFYRGNSILKFKRSNRIIRWVNYLEIVLQLVRVILLLILLCSSEELNHNCSIKLVQNSMRLRLKFIKKNRKSKSLGIEFSYSDWQMTWAVIHTCQEQIKKQEIF